MNFRQHFSHISAFLRQNKSIWQNEILARYPHEDSLFPENWVHCAQNLSLDELFKWEVQRDESVFNEPDLKTWLRQIRELTSIAINEDKKKSPQSFQNKDFFRIRGKKTT